MSQRFRVGDRVQMVRSLHAEFPRELIGLIGTVTEVDDLLNGDYNYDVTTSTDRTYYLHEAELEPFIGCVTDLA